MVIYSHNDPLLYIIFSSCLKGVVSDWFYSLSLCSLHNFEEVTKAFLTQYAFCQEARRTTIISSSSRKGITISLNHTSTSFKANDREKIVHEKCMFWNHELKVLLWLPQYFRNSIKAKHVESTRMEREEYGDRSFHCMFTCVLKSLQCFKESKENKTKSEKRRVRWNTKKWEHRREDICEFWNYF